MTKGPKPPRPTTTDDPALMILDDTDVAALHRILRWRRDVRHFRPDPIPEGVIDELRATMQSAPSVGNARPWRVIRVAAPHLRRAFCDNFAQANRRAADAYHGPQRKDYDALKLAGLETAPLLLAVFTHTDPAAGHRLGRASMDLTLRQSTAMAIHTLWLAARARNLGMGMVSILDPEAIGPLLHAPKAWEFSALLCLGWPEFDDDTPLLHRSGWQENTAPDWLLR